MPRRYRDFPDCVSKVSSGGEYDLEVEIIEVAPDEFETSVSGFGNVIREIISKCGRLDDEERSAVYCIKHTNLNPTDFITVVNIVPRGDFKYDYDIEGYGQWLRALLDECYHEE